MTRKGPRVSNKELADLIDQAIDQGWRVTRTGGGHLRFTPPDPKQPVLFGPSTPSEYRSVKNMRSKLKRHPCFE